MIIKFKKLSPDAIIPKKAHESDSGYDLYALEDHELKPLKQQLIKTGIAVALPDGYDAQVRPRSGLALKHGITVVNSPGTIDHSYNSDIGVVLMLLKPSHVTERIVAKLQHQGRGGWYETNTTSSKVVENKEIFKIQKGDRIAQLVISRVESLDAIIEEVDSIDDTIRGDGGFGSTGA